MINRLHAYLLSDDFDQKIKEISKLVLHLFWNPEYLIILFLFSLFTEQKMTHDFWTKLSTITHSDPLLRPKGGSFVNTQSS